MGKLNGFTAISLPGQFAPRSESASSTLANSLPGTFAPRSEMARKLANEKIYSYVYVPRKFQGTKWPGSERARERKDQGANWPGSYWPIRSIGSRAKRLGTIARVALNLASAVLSTSIMSSVEHVI